jgi:hypothetical protein
MSTTMTMRRLTIAAASLMPKRNFSSLLQKEIVSNINIGNEVELHTHTYI